MLAHSTRRAVISALIAVGLYLPASAASAQPAPTKVKIGIYGILPEAGLFIAKDRGYFAAENLNVEFVANAAGPEALPALTSGELDAVGGGMTPGVVNATKRGIPIKMVVSTSTWEDAGNSSFFLLRKAVAATVKEWKDLKGLKVAIAPAQPNFNGFIVERALALGGLTLKDVQAVEVPLSSMIVALRTGGVDAAHTSEPLSTVAVENGSAIKWKAASSYIPGLNPSMLSYGPNLLNKTPEVGERLLTAYLRGARDYAKAMTSGTGKDDIVAILIKNTPVKDRSLYDRMGMSHIDPDGVINLKHIRATLDYYQAAGAIQRTEVEALVDDRFRQAALKKLGPYKP
jgi:NitT/TauT family transport system substrate-binding protein